MEKQKIEIEDPRVTAEAYRQAPPEVREQIERTLAYALMSREETVQAFRELTAETSAYAERQGLTPEKLNALLREDDAGSERGSAHG